MLYGIVRAFDPELPVATVEPPSRVMAEVPAGFAVKANRGAPGSARTAQGGPRFP